MNEMDSKVIHLAKVILQSATEYDQLFTSTGQPSPTLDFDSFPEPSPPQEAQIARDKALDACTELQAILRGPVEIARNTVGQHSNVVYLQALYQFKVAKYVPPDGSTISYSELAAKCGLKEALLRRIVRYAITCHMFEEPQLGGVSHNGASKAFAQVPELEAWVGMHLEELWPASVRTVDAIQRWPSVEEPNQAGYQLAHNTDEHFFTYLSKYPARVERFAKAMSIQNRPAAIRTLVEGYPWAQLGASATVVDIGGSHGTAALALASAFSSLTLIVQDLPGVISKAPRPPPDLANRVSFLAHDFFTEQPVSGVEVYFFRYVFHDWPDKYCVQILKALTPAMKKGSKIIMNEFCLPEPGVWLTEKERAIRSFDLTMLTLQNSKERDAGEWEGLFQEADPRFKFVGIRKLLGPSSLIEAEWQDGPGEKVEN